MLIYLDHTNRKQFFLSHKQDRLGPPHLLDASRVWTVRMAEQTQVAWSVCPMTSLRRRSCSTSASDSSATCRCAEVGTTSWCTCHSSTWKRREQGFRLHQGSSIQIKTLHRDQKVLAKYMVSTMVLKPTCLYNCPLKLLLRN